MGGDTSMKKQHRVQKCLFLLTVCILVVSLLLPGCGGGAVIEEEVVTQEEEEVAEEEEEVVTQETSEPGEPEIVVPYTQTIVGNRANYVRGSYVTGTTIGFGACTMAWGDHFLKMAATEDTLFTYAWVVEEGIQKAILLSKKEGEDWQEGVSFKVLRLFNIFVDSQDYVHVIAYEPFVFDVEEEYFGRLFHVKFDQPSTVSGSYSLEYLTSDTKNNWGSTLDSSATYYCGVSIGEDDTILVVYTNPYEFHPGEGSRSLGARIYDPATGKWSYETVTKNLPSDFTYPFVAVTDKYFHVLAIEDTYDPELEVTGYPMRYGMIKHFQRVRDSGEWVESTLIDFNPTFSSLEISEFWLRHYELLVDSKGIVHALVLYCADEDGKPCSCEENPPRAYHYWKEESATEWHSEPAIDTPCGWLRLWERDNGKLFYVYSRWREQLCLIAMGTTERYVISNLVSPYIDEPNPFIAAARGGTNPSSILNLVVFSGTKECEGVVISVDTSDIK